MARKIVGIEEFKGVQTDVEREARDGASVEENADRSTSGVLKARLGLVDTGITDGTDPINALGHMRGEVGHHYIAVTTAGDVIGGPMPSPDW